jgi:hypothetical protein
VERSRLVLVRAGLLLRFSKAGAAVTDLTPEREEEIRANHDPKRCARFQTISGVPCVVCQLLAALDAERARNRNLEAAAKAARKASDELRFYPLGVESYSAVQALRAALAVLEEPQ